MSDDTPKMRTAGAVNTQLTERAEPTNFPGYQNPAGSIPGQRKGFSPEQTAMVARVRAWRREGIALLHEIGGTDPAPGHRGRFGSAELTHAKTNAMLAEFYAIFHITGGPE